MNVMQFRIYSAGYADGDVTVLPADRMRAERMSTKVLPPSQRGPQAAKTHSETWVLLWLYVASQRVQLVPDVIDFDTWADHVLDYDRLDADGNVPGAEDQVEDPAVDPTQPTEPTPSP